MLGEYFDTLPHAAAPFAAASPDDALGLLRSMLEKLDEPETMH